ncbi:NADAR family protein [Galbibacter sp. BG1]|nr:NADAR family protein [Galbibacter sp. BG1]
MEKFTFFWETTSPFSQWHKSKFTASTCLIQGVQMNKLKREYVLQNQFPSDVQEYSSAEQFMMYHKAIIFLDVESAKKIMSTNNVRKIKELGRNVSGFNEEVWRFYRSQIVLEGNRAKFEQNLYLKEELLKTRGTTLVEASPNDNIWGIGLKADNIKAYSRETWEGLNLLGEILTILRIEFDEEY